MVLNKLLWMIAPNRSGPQRFERFIDLNELSSLFQKELVWNEATATLFRIREIALADFQSFLAGFFASLIAPIM